MQDEQAAIQSSGEYEVSERTQHLVKYLEQLWQRPQVPSSEMLNHIVEFIVRFSEPHKLYQTLALTKIAESLVDHMSLHFIDIMATFEQKAEQEGIDREERDAILSGVFAEVFPEMMGLGKHLTIQSIDDLVVLGNITFGLYKLSQVDSAEDAQSWMFELPVLYRRQLAQERLLTSIQAHLTVTRGSTSARSMGTTSGYIAWNSSLPAPAPIQVSMTTNKIVPTLA